MLKMYGKEFTSERFHNGVQYLDFFKFVNDALRPETYFEIGTNQGHSLAAFSCDAVCVDPNFSINLNVLNARTRAFFFQMTSDRFFKLNQVRDFLPEGPDICFLDGMHRFEFLLRDFLNTEKECRSNSIIFLHDCLPLNERMAERERRLDEREDESTRHFWTGDVWRILPVLKKFRSDLQVRLLDCGPTGLVACTRLNPHSLILRQHYDEIVEFAMNLALCDFGLDQLWNVYPMVDTACLCANPVDITAAFNIS